MMTYARAQKRKEEVMIFDNDLRTRVLERETLEEQECGDKRIQREKKREKQEEKAKKKGASQTTQHSSSHMRSCLASIKACCRSRKPLVSFIMPSNIGLACSGPFIRVASGIYTNILDN